MGSEMCIRDRHKILQPGIAFTNMMSTCDYSKRRQKKASAQQYNGSDRREGQLAHCKRSATRMTADRARGLSDTSCSDGITALPTWRKDPRCDSY